MKNRQPTTFQLRAAFTLVELLIVIAIIAILAALLFPAFQGVKKAGTIRKVKAELKQVETAIESYKARFGNYPPDNPCNFATNQLYFELLGSVLENGQFKTKDGSAYIQDNDGAFNTAYFSNGGKPCVRGFQNVSRPGGDGESLNAESFLKGLKPGQSAELSSAAGVKYLTCTVHGYNDALNPWRYNSSSPTNNPKSFDLWVDIIINNKTNRISNWSDQPSIVSY